MAEAKLTYEELKNNPHGDTGFTQFAANHSSVSWIDFSSFLIGSSLISAPEEQFKKKSNLHYLDRWQRIFLFKQQCYNLFVETTATRFSNAANGPVHSPISR